MRGWRKTNLQGLAAELVAESSALLYPPAMEVWMNAQAARPSRWAVGFGAQVFGAVFVFRVEFDDASEGCSGIPMRNSARIKLTDL